MRLTQTRIKQRMELTPFKVKAVKQEQEVKDLWHIYLSISSSAMNFAKFSLFYLWASPDFVARGRGAKEANFVARGQISKIDN